MPEEFRIVGYVMDKAGTVDEIQYDRLTHINYAFLIPNEDGSVRPLFSPRKLAQLIASAHENGVKVLLSIGGWGYDGQFEALAADPASRARLIDEVVKQVEKRGFDGADMDWEYPDVGESAHNFVALMQELSAAMHGRGKLTTAAVVALGPNAESILPEVFDCVDFLNIMAYDGPDENHSSYQYAVDALDYWRGRGLPRAKAVLGLPFYGRPGGVPYKVLVEADEAAPQVDQVEYRGKAVYYNGIGMVQRKTELALQRGAGIMIWALTHDTSDETSLLRAIHRRARGAE